MRYVIAYYLFIFYTLAICKPVLPLIQDMLSHAFWEAEHIATVHQHHGNHHAESEMAEDNHEDGSHDTGIIKSAEPVSLHTVSRISYHFIAFSSKKQEYYPQLSYLPNAHLEKNYPPPKM